MELLSEQQLQNFPKEAVIALYLQMGDSLRTVISQNAELRDQNAVLLKKVDALQEDVAVLVQNRFGRKTAKVEKQTDGQYYFDVNTMAILNEAEVLTENGKAEEPEVEEVIVHRTHRRPTGKQVKDLEAIPKKMLDCTLPEETLKQLFPDGYSELPTSDAKPLLEYTPAQFQQIIYRIHVYKGKDGTIVRAPHPERLFNNSLATPSMVSATMNAKYINSVPLERFSDELKKYDVILSREVLATWMIRASDRYFFPLYGLMQERMIQSASLIHCDETPFVLVNNGRGPGSKDYMWVYHTGPSYGSPPVYLYQYCPTRKTENPERFLEGYSGVLMTDGYQVYHSLEKKKGGSLKVAGCWAHMKRKYSEVRKSLGGKTSHGLLCTEAEKKISAIYAVDNAEKGQSPEKILQNRQTVVKKLVDAYFDWVREKIPLVDPSSATGRALQYSLNQEPFLRVFLDDPKIPLDNNDAERSIRKFCVGKKNWQICASKNGAEASAVLYSVAETAKANGLRPYFYFKYVMEQMLLYQDGTDRSFLDDLLPWSDKLPEYCRARK